MNQIAGIADIPAYQTRLTASCSTTWLNLHFHETQNYRLSSTCKSTAGVIKLHGGEGFLDTQGYHAYSCPRVCELVLGCFLLLSTHFIIIFTVMIKCLEVHVLYMISYNLFYRLSIQAHFNKCILNQSIYINFTCNNKRKVRLNFM